MQDYDKLKSLNSNIDFNKLETLAAQEGLSPLEFYDARVDKTKIKFDSLGAGSHEGDFSTAANAKESALNFILKGKELQESQKTAAREAFKSEEEFNEFVKEAEKLRFKDYSRDKDFLKLDKSGRAGFIKRDQNALLYKKEIDELEDLAANAERAGGGGWFGKDKEISDSLLTEHFKKVGFSNVKKEENGKWRALKDATGEVVEFEVKPGFWKSASKNSLEAFGAVVGGALLTGVAAANPLVGAAVLIGGSAAGAGVGRVLDKRAASGRVGVDYGAGDAFGDLVGGAAEDAILGAGFLGAGKAVKAGFDAYKKSKAAVEAVKEGAEKVGEAVAGTVKNAEQLEAVKDNLLVKSTRWLPVVKSFHNAVKGSAKLEAEALADSSITKPLLDNLEITNTPQNAFGKFFMSPEKQRRTLTQVLRSKVTDDAAFLDNTKVAINMAAKEASTKAELVESLLSSQKNFFEKTDNVVFSEEQLKEALKKITSGVDDDFASVLKAVRANEADAQLLNFEKDKAAEAILKGLDELILNNVGGKKAAYEALKADFTQTLKRGNFSTLNSLKTQLSTHEVDKTTLGKIRNFVNAKMGEFLELNKDLYGEGLKEAYQSVNSAYAKGAGFKLGKELAKVLDAPEGEVFKAFDKLIFKQSHELKEGTLNNDLIDFAATLSPSQKELLERAVLTGLVTKNTALATNVGKAVLDSKAITKTLETLKQKSGLKFESANSQTLYKAIEDFAKENKNVKELILAMPGKLTDDGLAALTANPITAAQLYVGRKFARLLFSTIDHDTPLTRVLNAKDKIRQKNLAAIWTDAAGLKIRAKSSGGKFVENPLQTKSVATELSGFFKDHRAGKNGGGGLSGGGGKTAVNLGENLGGSGNLNGGGLTPQTAQSVKAALNPQTQTPQAAQTAQNIKQALSTQTPQPQPTLSPNLQKPNLTPQTAEVVTPTTVKAVEAAAPLGREVAAAKTARYVDEFAKTSDFKALSSDKQEAILSLKEIKPNPMPEGLVKSVDSKNIITHFSKKLDGEARKFYYKLFDEAKTKPDIVLLNKNGKTEYIKAYEHTAQKDMYYLAFTQDGDGVKVTGIPTTQIRKVVEDIAQSEKVAKAEDLEGILELRQADKIQSLQLASEIATKSEGQSQVAELEDDLMKRFEVFEKQAQNDKVDVDSWFEAQRKQGNKDVLEYDKDLEIYRNKTAIKEALKGPKKAPAVKHEGLKELEAVLKERLKEASGDVSFQRAQARKWRQKLESAQEAQKSSERLDHLKFRLAERIGDFRHAQRVRTDYEAKLRELGGVESSFKELSKKLSQLSKNPKPQDLSELYATKEGLLRVEGLLRGVEVRGNAAFNKLRSEVTQALEKSFDAINAAKKGLTPKAAEAAAPTRTQEFLDFTQDAKERVEWALGVSAEAAEKTIDELVKKSSGESARLKFLERLRASVKALGKFGAS